MSLIISSYLVPLAGMGFLMALILSNPLFSKRQTQFFLLAVSVNILLIFTTALDYLFTNEATGAFWMARRVTSFFNFAFSPLISLALLRILDDKKAKWILYAPVVLNGALCFLSMFTGWVFSIGAFNNYDRGPLFFLPSCLTFLYLLMLILQPVRSHQSQNKRMERFLLCAVIGLITLSMGLEIIYGYFFLNYSCSALGLIMYYLLLNIQGYTIDPLTGVKNRITYNRALDELPKGGPRVIALLDINGFKAVNDTYGHDAGDKYLIRFTALLQENLRSLCTTYRIGGDEFVLISKKSPDGKMAAQLAHTRTLMEAQGFSFAYGLQIYTPPQNLEDFMRQVDERMYGDKAKMRKIRKN